MAKTTLKDLLVARGLAPDVHASTRKIIAHEVKVDGAYATMPGMMVKDDADVEVAGEKQFVSRGGLKLQHALDEFKVQVEGKNCLDIGSSTGGFSDSLLQAGAGRVACVDVNYGQLAWEVRQNPRSAVFERTNIKNADPAELGAPFDIVVIDVSFIGLASLAETIASFCKTGSELIALIKPQFEAEHDETVGGLVEDEAVRMRTIDEVKAAVAAVGFDVVGVVESPIKGKKLGNTEYLLYAKFVSCGAQREGIVSEVENGK